MTNPAPVGAVRKALRAAVEVALAGDWQGAHEVAQRYEEDPTACWLHAVVHRMEGDVGNARYWYGRCGRSLREEVSTADELREILAALAQGVEQKHADEPVAIATITASELRHGVLRATTAGQRQRREAFVERLLGALPILPFDLVAARIHASLWAGLAAKGTNVGAHDLLIGATAIAVGCRVATRDRRAFGRIPGLEVVLL